MAKTQDNMMVTTFSQCRIVGFKNLTAEGQKYYRKKCEELMKMGLLKTTQLQSLLTWADCYDLYWRLRNEVNDEGWTFTSHNKFGDPVISANPKVKMMNDALKQASAVAAEFGLTPKAAKRLKGEEATKSPLDDWID